MRLIFTILILIFGTHLLAAEPGDGAAPIQGSHTGIAQLLDFNSALQKAAIECDSSLFPCRIGGQTPQEQLKAKLDADIPTREGGRISNANWNLGIPGNFDVDIGGAKDFKVRWILPTGPSSSSK